MKYIDAEKLKERIAKLEADSCISEYKDGFDDGVGCVLDIIDSLQQGQPASGSSEKPNNHSSEKREQQEVDLEKEILDWIGDEGSCKNGKWTWYECNKMIRHFYELGLNARKEE